MTSTLGDHLEILHNHWQRFAVSSAQEVAEHERQIRDQRHFVGEERAAAILTGESTSDLQLAHGQPKRKRAP